MELIKIHNEYSINTEKYTQLKTGTIIKSKSQLRQMLCYPTIPAKTANNGTMQALQSIIDKFIRYESAGGYKIRITAIESPQIVKEIAETLIQSKQGINTRQSYGSNRKYLLDHIIHSRGTNPAYLTTRNIINKSTRFQGFYYEYCGMNYDKTYSNDEEIKELDEFIKEYAISDKQYLIEIMEILNNILYNTVFDSNNIFNWAGKRDITAEKVLYQDRNELDTETSIYIENNYFQPLIDKGVPAKVRTKIANINYMRDNKLSPKKYQWFYYTYKFTIKDPESFKIKKNNTEFHHNKAELTAKVLARLEREALHPQGENYHPQTARNFDEIMSRLKI